jgi:magnesium-transporting ATPase (P-type)
MLPFQKLTIITVIIIMTMLLVITLIINKKTIDNFDNKIELHENIKNLKILIWINFTIVNIITIYLMYVVFSKKSIKKHFIIFILNIFLIILNIGVSLYMEITLQDPTKDKLNNIYIISTMSTIINSSSIILLLYKFNEIENDINLKNIDINLDYNQLKENQQIILNDIIQRRANELQKQINKQNIHNEIEDDEHFFITHNL